MYKAKVDSWYMERIIWMIAGFVSLLGVGLGFYVNKLWFLLDGFVGVNLLIFGATGFCLMANILYALGARTGLCETVKAETKVS